MANEDEDFLLVSDRLKWALTRRKLKPNAPALAKATSVKEGTARTYLNDTRQPTLSVCLSIGKALGVNGFWLHSGEGDRMASSATLEGDGGKPYAPLPSSFKRNLITVYSASLAGPDGEVELVIERSHQAPCPTSLEEVADAYGTTVGGDSMLDRFRNGETVFVNPNTPIVRGDDVVVQIYADGGEGAVFGLVKRFVSFGATELVLEQLNPKKELRYPRSSIKAVHKIVDHTLR